MPPTATPQPPQALGVAAFASDGGSKVTAAVSVTASVPNGGGAVTLNREVSLDAVAKISNKVVVQPVVITIQGGAVPGMPLFWVELTIAKLLTVPIHEEWLLTLAGRVVPQPGDVPQTITHDDPPAAENPQQPPANEQPQEGGETPAVNNPEDDQTPPPISAPPSAPPAEDPPTQTPVNNESPQEGGTPPENNTPGEGNPAPAPTPVTSPPAPEPANPPQTPVSTPPAENPPPTPVNNESPARKPFYLGYMVMAKVEFRYSGDENVMTNQTVSGCFVPNGASANNGWRAGEGACGEGGRGEATQRESVGKLLSVS